MPDDKFRVTRGDKPPDPKDDYGSQPMKQGLVLCYVLGSALKIQMEHIPHSVPAGGGQDNSRSCSL